MKGSVRIRNKRYSYYFKYKDEYGKWKTKEKGGFKTKKGAESAMRKAITDFEESNFIEKSDLTLNESIEYWCEHVGNTKLKYSTLKSYKVIWKNHIEGSIGKVRESSLTPNLLQLHFTEKSNEVPGSIGTIRNVISNSLNLAVKHQRIKQNPMKLIENVSLKTQKTLPLTREEIEEIDIALKQTNEYHRTAFTVALHTGMRRGEVLGLTWDNVDFENNLITVNKQLQKQNGKLILVAPKTKSSNRVFQMTTVLYEYLLKLHQGQLDRKNFYQENYYQRNFVCCHLDSRPIPPDTLCSKIRRTAKAIGIDFHFHQLRHTHATMLMEADINLKVIQERLGHAKIDMLINTYAHVTKKLEDQAIEKFNSFF